MIHRDIKPSNLLWRDAGASDLVLTDFGISSYSDSSSHGKVPQRGT